jgi:hypothetical protein
VLVLSTTSALLFSFNSVIAYHNAAPSKLSPASDKSRGSRVSVLSTDLTANELVLRSTASRRQCTTALTDKGAEASGTAYSSNVDVTWRRRVLRNVLRKPNTSIRATALTADDLETNVESLKSLISAGSSPLLRDGVEFIQSDFEIFAPANIYSPESFDGAVAIDESSATSVASRFGVYKIPAANFDVSTISRSPDPPDTRLLQKAMSEQVELNEMLAKVEAEVGVTSDDLNPMRPAAGSRFTRTWYENVIGGFLHRWSRGDHTNLRVRCLPHPVSLLLGQARVAEAIATFDRISFGNVLKVSGGTVSAKGMTVNLFSFLPATRSLPRFPDRFDFEAKDVKFTDEDLFASDGIRNGLRSLLVRILKQVSVQSSDVSITSVRILPSNEVAVRGEATTFFGSSLTFEARCGLEVAGQGHVLRFPGLKVALNPAMGLFVPILPPLSLDLGHNTQIHDLRLDGRSRTLLMSARTTITPSHTRALPKKYQQSSDAYGAKFAVDVGLWLTRLGNFSHPHRC